jgi:hypothetical protein
MDLHPPGSLSIHLRNDCLILFLSLSKTLQCLSPGSLTDRLEDPQDMREDHKRGGREVERREVEGGRGSSPVAPVIDQFEEHSDLVIE